MPPKLKSRPPPGSEGVLQEGSSLSSGGVCSISPPLLLFPYLSPPHLGHECISHAPSIHGEAFLMISLCISNFSLSRCQKWEKVTTLPRIDHTHSQKGPIAIQLFSFAHQTREDGMVSVRGNQKIERGKGLYI